MITFDQRFKNDDGSKFVPLIEVTDSLGQKTLSPHQCPNRKPYHQKKEEEEEEEEQQEKFQESELADLQKEVADVKTLVKTLISQVQLARQEIGELKKRK